ncbi:MAG: DUF177 domain-containing protein [Chloroflexota bacterium]|nr:DUF177 domain-containing protein [Chloroflexota bacterium]
MRFNVAQMLQEPIGSTRWHKVQEARASWEGLQARHLEGWLKFTRTDMGIWVLGRLTAEVSAECSRCLADIEEPLGTEISEQFYPTVDISTGMAVANELVEDEAFRIDATNELDVREALRQNLITSLPMKPLCKPECAGICPECGVNRNESKCQCGEDIRDPRWARLYELLPSTDPGVERGR